MLIFRKLIGRYFKMQQNKHMWVKESNENVQILFLDFSNLI